VRGLALVLVVAAIAVIYLLWQDRPRSAAGDLCAIDPYKTINAMLAARNAGEAMVPHGFAVEEKPIQWRAIDQVRVYRLPSRNAKSVALKPGFSGRASCRVKDEDGQWWIVNGRDRTGFLSYEAEDDVLVTAP
jgi:hypothetical protein